MNRDGNLIQEMGKEDEEKAKAWGEVELLILTYLGTRHLDHLPYITLEAKHRVMSQSNVLVVIPRGIYARARRSKTGESQDHMPGEATSTNLLYSEKGKTDSYCIISAVLQTSRTNQWSQSISVACSMTTLRVKSLE